MDSISMSFSISFGMGQLSDRCGLNEPVLKNSKRCMVDPILDWTCSILWMIEGLLGSHLGRLSRYLACRNVLSSWQGLRSRSQVPATRYFAPIYGTMKVSPRCSSFVLQSSSILPLKSPRRTSSGAGPRLFRTISRSARRSTEGTMMTNPIPSRLGKRSTSIS